MFSENYFMEYCLSANRRASVVTYMQTFKTKNLPEFDTLTANFLEEYADKVRDIVSNNCLIE